MPCVLSHLNDFVVTSIEPFPERFVITVVINNDWHDIWQSRNLTCEILGGCQPVEGVDVNRNQKTVSCRVLFLRIPCSSRHSSRAGITCSFQ